MFVKVLVQLLYCGQACGLHEPAVVVPQLKVQEPPKLEAYDCQLLVEQHLGQFCGDVGYGWP